VCALHYRIDHEKKIVYQTFKGEIFFSDIEKMKNDLLSDPDYDKSYDNITDLSNAWFKCNESQMFQYIQLFLIENKECLKKRNMIVINDPRSLLMFLFNKIFDVFKDDLLYMDICESQEEAEEEIMSFRKIYKFEQ
jgi:hypothetical protein